MNDTRYGLTAGVYTKDEAKARELLARVNAGSVYWNCCDRVSPRLPWSGMAIRRRSHALRVWHPDLHAAEGVASSLGLKLALFDLDYTLLVGDSDALWCEFCSSKAFSTGKNSVHATPRWTPPTAPAP